MGHDISERDDGSTLFVDRADAHAPIRMRQGGALDIGGVTMSVAVEGGNEIDVTCVFTDAAGQALAERRCVHAYLSDDADGDSIAGTAPDAGWDIATDGLLIPIVADKAAMLVCEADGSLDITIGESGVDTWFLVIVLPGGTLVVSAAITFA